MIKASEIKVIKLPFMVPAWAAAQVILKNTIFWNDKYTLSAHVISHELVHVEQQRRYGMLRYWFEYACRLATSGYKNHKFEREAEARADEYLRVARQIVDRENYFESKRTN